MPPKRLAAAKSGIGFDTDSKSSKTQKTSFVTSRTARVLLAGAGFLADAYDLFVINLVLRLLRDEYPSYAASGKLRSLEGAVASAALFGSIFGQVGAGSLADVIGRKKIFVGTAALIIIGSIGASLCIDSGYFSIYTQIACWRAFLGMGVGGEYPLAATVTSESSSASKRGTLMAAVFAMQGVGALLSVVVVLFCLSIGLTPGITWRFALAFGAVPAILAFPWRMRMHETESFERVKEARKHGVSHSSEFLVAFRLYKWHMLGTALSWFLLDVDFYANGLFNHDVTSVILSAGLPSTPFYDARNAAIVCLMGVPGYWLSVLYLERVGRKSVQFMGFMMMAILFLICGLGHSWFLAEVSEGYSYRKWMFLFLYGLTFLFSNFGPNTTTFVIPGEIYPPTVRATCHGFSAASGKLGAATGAYFFPLLLGPGGSVHPTEFGLQRCMLICSLIAVLGALVTYFLTPSYDAMSLDEDEPYLALEFHCLRPSPEQLSLLNRNDMPGSSYTMVQTIEGHHEYSMPELSLE